LIARGLGRISAYGAIRSGRRGASVSGANKRVLFVDDDQAILDGLEDLFFRDRKRWDMAFALGGVRALALLRARPFDVVVSDMRMLGMDGATFLDIVKNEFPGTVRIVLSGHAERASIMRALTSMHQYFSKPCDANRLRAAIDRSLEIAGRPSGDLRALIGKLDKLPSPPVIYLELTKLVNDPSSTLADAVRIVARDPALAAKALQLANSVAFGPRRAITSIDDCVAYLGIDLVRCLALTSSVFGGDLRASAAGLSLEDMQTTALRTAVLTRKLVDERKNADIAFAAALLHDIGEAVLAVGLPEAYGDLLCAARAASEPLVVAERREFGATHAEIGACLLGMWGLPEDIVEIVAYHHDPGAAPSTRHAILAALHVADAVTAPLDARYDHAIDPAVLETLGCTARLDDWRALAEQA
jgi:putative nucleotidyltransferase with HDIG domain